MFINKLWNQWKFNLRGRFRFQVFLLLLVVSAISTFLLYPRPEQPLQLLRKQSNYEIHARQSFNQPRYYPIKQTVTSNLYRPLDPWVGRLILPKKQEMQTGWDWVWLEIHHAPPEAQSLVGKVVRLEWKNKPEVQSYVQAVKRDVRFTPATKASERKGNIHPSRLNNRLGVGALQSLVGARPNDDVIVTLDRADLAKSANGKPILQIEHEPVLATGRFYGLVKILKPVSKELFRVRHYNPASGDFDSAVETIRIPQQVVDRRNIPPSTPNQLQASPAGKAGWYIYGAKDAKGVFVAQAIAPRSLFQLQPQSVILGEEAGLTYIKEQNWQITAADKGTIKTVLLDPQAIESEQALSEWKEGDKAIVVNLFGGIGGKKGEALPAPGTVTGHFAFGVAEVVRDPFTNELQFAIEYQQVYAHNPDGIISGTQTWANYMGNLQWGWMATRPVSDILIKFDPVTQDYNFDGITLSPLTEFLQQLQVMMARYRVGDGTGSATVSPASSCIQDSSQALYAAIKVIKQQISSTPAIQEWLTTHPDDPQTLRFQQLASLGSTLEKKLLPLGIVRADWASNAGALAGIGEQAFTDPSIWAGLTSWRTIIPRQAHDELAALFLRNGAKLWFLRTNQVGGWNPDIMPLAATELGGQVTIPFTQVSPVPMIIHRILASLAVPQGRDWLIVAATLFIYSAIALPLGLSSGFLQLSVWSGNWINQLLLILRSLITPALTEELVFRVLLLSHPTEVVNWGKWGLWAGLSLLLFIIYHPLNAKTFFPAGFPTFFDPVFLTLTGLLGLACTVVYALTGSLWAIATIHWIVVVVWLLLFGGMEKLHPDKSQQPGLAE